MKTFLTPLMFVLLLSPNVFAGACWPNEKTWDRYTVTVNDFLMDQMKSAVLKGEKFGEVYGEGEPAVLKKDAQIEKVAAVPGGFRIFTEKSEIIFHYGKKGEFFTVDTGERPNGHFYLYKDLVLEGNIQIKGPLAKALEIRNTKGRFIFYGHRGNQCLSLAGTQFWKLQFSLMKKLPEFQQKENVGFEAQGTLELP